MRLNVAISTLSACLIGLSTADKTREIAVLQGRLDAEPSQNLIVSFETYLPPGLPLIPLSPHSGSNFSFVNNSNVTIAKVSLKSYNGSGLMNGNEDRPIAKARTRRRSPWRQNDDKDLLTLTQHYVAFEWSQFNKSFLNYPLYLQCEWQNSSVSGNSSSQLFAVYEGDTKYAVSNLNQTGEINNISGAAPPAREEYTQSSSSTPSATLGTATSSTPGTGPTATTNGIQASSQGPSGLSRNGIIGVAVGVGVAGLLVAGVLAWLCCIRRRKSATRQVMPSYGSEVGVHTIIQDKEIPAVIETSSPQSTYGGEERPSADHYAPYSDRSATSPAPHHRRTTSAAATAAAATSETDLSWSRGAPTPTSVIASRYAHLVEEGMTEDEIRRLEEEERQLDVAIEHAGRRGNS
ncbi:hypothetical protein F5X98DRAFT_369217 [Xylaria grammica]|nr:hypothetical protein F5X98DRAFT_369217 [Xylaria grammica]